MKSVRFRYLEPGSDAYTYLDAEDLGDGKWGSLMPRADVEIIVIYEGEPDGKDGDGDGRNDAGNNDGAGWTYRRRPAREADLGPNFSSGSSFGFNGTRVSQRELDYLLDKRPTRNFFSIFSCASSG